MIDLLSISKNYTLLNLIPQDFLIDKMNNNAMRVKNYNKGEVIHFDEDICNSVDVILFGKAKVERIDESGNLLTITVSYPDDILGGNLVFSKNPYYPMTVSAETDATLLSIHRDLIFELCTTSTDFLMAYLEYISDHAILLGDKIKHYVNRTIRESITAFLKNEYMVQNSNRIFLNSTKKVLADRIGVQRTSLSRELQKMKNDGLIDFDMVSITIIDLSLLK